MNTEEFRRRWEALQVKEPDEWDKKMLAEIEAEKDDPVYPLEEVLANIKSRDRRITLRLPKTLHEDLVKTAAAEGVSMNQYLLHTISTGRAVERMAR
ncbi:MAG: type II toxin-antitoxin system HicB family antitoxin [Chloroflexi bacterium]|nr:type II toxin-antitoxin system HicB family antitoxin [Chloroflexota bacterium]